MPESSAVIPGAVNTKAIPLHKNHINLVKFCAVDDHAFRTVSQHICIMVEDAIERVG